MASHRSMAARSYVNPSAAMTGSTMSSWVIGQQNEGGHSGARPGSTPSSELTALPSSSP